MYYLVVHKTENPTIGLNFHTLLNIYKLVIFFFYSYIMIIVVTVIMTFKICVIHISELCVSTFHTCEDHSYGQCVYKKVSIFNSQLGAIMRPIFISLAV